jgi:hypothetical protein
MSDTSRAVSPSSEPTTPIINGIPFRVDGSVPIGQVRFVDTQNERIVGIINNVGAESPPPATSEPLPCPFCGEAPKMRQWQDETLMAGHAIVWHTAIRCRDCDVAQMDESPDKKQSEVLGIAAWNRRSPSSAPPEADATNELGWIADRIDGVAESLNTSLLDDCVSELRRLASRASAPRDTGDSEQLALRIDKARESLSRGIKTRDCGRCDECQATTPSGMDPLCHDCAVRYLLEAAADLRGTP